MKNIDYNYLCTVIGKLSGIPLRLYKDAQQLIYHSLVHLPKDPMNLYKKEIFDIKTHIGYFITPYFNYYGVVNSTPYKIVIGPSRQVSISDWDIRELAFKCDVIPDEVEDFVTGMKSIVRMPLESIMQIMGTMNYVMNDEKLGLGDITIYDTLQDDLKAKIETEHANQEFDFDIAAIQSQQTVHNALALEQTIMNIVRKGDTASLKE